MQDEAGVSPAVFFALQSFVPRRMEFICCRRPGFLKAAVLASVFQSGFDGQWHAENAVFKTSILSTEPITWILPRYVSEGPSRGERSGMCSRWGFSGDSPDVLALLPRTGRRVRLQSQLFRATNQMHRRRQWYPRRPLFVSLLCSRLLNGRTRQCRCLDDFW